MKLSLFTFSVTAIGGCRQENSNVKFAPTNLAARPLSESSTIYHSFLSREFLNDTSQNKWENLGGPELLAQLETTPTNSTDYVPLLRMVMHIASELAAVQDSPDVVTLLDSYCSEMLRVRDLKPNAPIDGESEETQIIRETPLANLDTICPHTVMNFMEIGYPVLMQKLHRKNILELSNESEAEISFTNLDELNFEQILEFFTSVSSTKLRRGLILPSGISMREFIDRVLETSPGFPHAGVVDIADGLDVLYTLRQMEGVGKFVAFSLLQMEPLNISLSYGVITGSMRPVDRSITGNWASFCRGFQSVIDAEISSKFSVSMFRNILEGREIESGDIEVVADEIVRPRLTPLLTQEWAQRTNGGRGVAMGHFCDKFLLKIQLDETQTEPVIFERGGKVFVSRNFVDSH